MMSRNQPTPSPEAEASARAARRCPACGRPGWSDGGLVGPFPLARCPACSHAFLSDDADLQEALAGAYEHDYAGHRDDPVFAANLRGELAERIVPRVSPPAKVLDVGCGNGTFLEAATAAGFAARGLEVSDAGVARCRERGLDAQVGELADIEAGCFDLVTFWDVLEHVPDPQALLLEARRVLRPGGWVLVKSPWVSDRALGVSARIPRLVPSLLQAPKHRHYFRPRSLEAALRAAGFAHLQWFPAAGLRGDRRPSSPLRRARKALRRGLLKVVGDGNVYAMGRRAPGD